VGAAAALAAPGIARGQGGNVLRFVPSADVTVLDPIISVAYVTRNHALMVFDTLYGIDAHNVVRPQMVEGHTVEQDGKVWTLTLREGLRFHDGAPVLGRDVVASLKRWGARDNFGSALFAVVDELSAPTDRTVRFRLKSPFPMLPDALAKIGTNTAVVMPERLANTDPFKQVTEMVGSGPFRFVADERIPGARAVYQRFDGYVPRDDATSVLAGAKRVHFERVEWITMPDGATAAAALQSGEVDWWENPGTDYWDLLRRNRRLKVEVLDPYGSAGVVRFNFTQAPADNPALRRAALAAISQADVMTAVAGTDRDAWKDRVGFFLPGSPMASDVGLDALKEPPDRDAAKRMLEASGYKGETLVYITAGDSRNVNIQAEIVSDALRQVGFKIDLQTMDWGTMLARAGNRKPAPNAIWHITGSFTAGVGLLNPSSNNFLRGSGSKAIFGWPDIPRIEELRTAWFTAPDTGAQAAICREIQKVAFETLPYLPTGLYRGNTAYRSDLADMQKLLPLFYGIRRA